MLICGCTSASVTVSFIIIPWRADSRQCIHTSIDFAYGQSRWNCCSLHATRAHKVFCYSSSKYWLKEGHYKPKEVQKDKASKRRTVLPKEGQLTPMSPT